MDVALEIEERVETENYTANSTDNEFYDGLRPQQLVGLVFSLVCFPPNILLLYIIFKNRLSATVYWTIANWSALNSMLLLIFLPFNIVPARYLSSVVVELFFHFGVISTIFTGALVTLFMYDFFLKSEKIAKHSTTTIWFLIAFLDLFIVVVVFKGELYLYIVSLILDITFLLISFLFLIRVIYSCVRPSQDGNYKLRIRLCSTYMISLFLVYAAELMIYYIHNYYALLALGAVVVLYLDGYVNLILLIYYDPRIKRHFMQIFRASDKYADMKFDAQNSTVVVVDQNLS